MAIVDLDLWDLYKKEFGGDPTSFNPQIAPVLGDTELSRVNAGKLGSPYYATDLVLGVEYFMPVLLTYPDTSADSSGLLPGGTGILMNWNLPFPMVKVGCKKTMVETPLTERRGSVKELINIQDYKITITGFLIAGTNDFPEAQVTALRNLWEQSTPITIKCPMTDIFLLRPDRSGSDQVVIVDFDVTTKKGVKNVVDYKLELVSDEPFNLIDIS